MDTDIYFTVSDTQFHALNFSHETFHRVIPSHSHGDGSYEIHYIADGKGYTIVNGTYYEITPGTLFVTGPHIEHAQIPHPQEPMSEYCIYWKTEKKRKTSLSVPPYGERASFGI